MLICVCVCACVCKCVYVYECRRLLFAGCCALTGNQLDKRFISIYPLLHPSTSHHRVHASECECVRVCARVCMRARVCKRACMQASVRRACVCVLLLTSVRVSYVSYVSCMQVIGLLGLCSSLYFKLDEYDSPQVD
jgi:hypothetical protein